MKRLRSMLVLTVAAACLSGCYYDPGYSYVRASGTGGDAYYGEGRTVIYDDGYYPGYVGPGYYGAPGYYGYGYGYPPGVSVGIGTVWYGGSHHRHGRDHDWRRDRGHDGHWRGHDRDSHGRGHDHDRSPSTRYRARQEGRHAYPMAPRGTSPRSAPSHRSGQSPRDARYGSGRRGMARSSHDGGHR